MVARKWIDVLPVIRIHHPRRDHDASMLARRDVITGETSALKEDAGCVTLCKPESHILLLRSLSSTCAVSLVRRAKAGGHTHEQARPSVCLHRLQEDD
jgi:hypothetical protein